MGKKILLVNTFMCASCKKIVNRGDRNRCCDKFNPTNLYINDIDIK